MCDVCCVTCIEIALQCAVCDDVTGNECSLNGEEGRDVEGGKE